MKPEDTLDNMIAEKELRRNELQKLLDAIDAEIKTLREVKNRIGGHEKKERKIRPLNEDWKDVLNYMGRVGPMSQIEIQRFFRDKLLKEINPDTLRSQLSIYTTKGWLQRIKQGVYKLTEAGAEKCGFSQY